MSDRNEVQQRRLDTLCEGVEEALDKGHGRESVKVAVLKMGKQSSLAGLARELKLDRPHLSLCLRLKRNAASVRRALEFNLALPAGGMERVLEILEEGIHAQTEA